MSTETPLVEGSVRVAIGDLLRAEWRADNALGYTPTADEGTDAHLDVTLGTYSEDNPVPTLALRAVSETPDTSASAIKATGEGSVQTTLGRIDIQAYVGADGDLPGGENAQLAAKRIGLEVRSILHDNEIGVMDSSTGELLATNLVCSRPTVVPDPDLPGPEFVGRQEVTYEINDDPPTR